MLPSNIITLQKGWSVWAQERWFRWLGRWLAAVPTPWWPWTALTTAAVSRLVRGICWVFRLKPKKCSGQNFPWYVFSWLTCWYDHTQLQESQGDSPANVRWWTVVSPQSSTLYIYYIYVIYIVLIYGCPVLSRYSTCIRKRKFSMKIRG